ncbi:peptidoglycan editing factor PgeF [Janthinobacterium agaricidamnosum]|nr:peptidoglycan editing factor PgeF [Janthinobacterium agaricidamnosum]
MSLPLLLPHWPDLPAGIGALSTLRSGGISLAPYGATDGSGGLNLGQHVGDRPEHVQHNRDALAALLPSQPVWLSQVHGTKVVDAAQVAGGDVPEADASFAAAPSAVCLVMSADCLPVLFSALDGSVVAAAHAGWRGLAGGVLNRTVSAMRHAGVGAGEITAWLGPAIGASQFEVGADVLAAFQAGASDDGEARRVKAAFTPIDGRPGKYLADIYALARIFLRRGGVERVSGGEFCTVSDAARFYSYRRDGVTGRQASLIWRK